MCSLVVADSDGTITSGQRKKKMRGSSSSEVRGALARGGRLRRHKKFSGRRRYILVDIPLLSPSNFGRSVTITLDTQTNGHTTTTQSLLTHPDLIGVSESIMSMLAPTQKTDFQVPRFPRNIECRIRGDYCESHPSACFRALNSLLLSGVEYLSILKK